ncbi:carboxypeptidase regulatory-like domain-containing protein [Bosea sp. (in: a-proteobacteria)]|uniref:carboxypeptidase regulatory-like domain-containing protein n=1 Tax=Bosea sp. (in: a-proteobacteria) TaxID=1871050 RepID=UPI003341F026
MKNGVLKSGILALTALAGALVAGCVERKPGTVAFSAEEAAFIKKRGSGIIAGHAFRTKPSGVVVNAAGEVVRLVPATEFARERFANLYGKRKYIPHAAYPRDDAVDPAYAAYTRTTKAESNGRFVFENVAPGSYFLTTQVVWGDEAAFSREGGSVYDMVTLTGKETEPVQVILSGN